MARRIHAIGTSRPSLCAHCVRFMENPGVPIPAIRLAALAAQHPWIMITGFLLLWRRNGRSRAWRHRIRMVAGTRSPILRPVRP